MTRNDRPTKADLSLELSGLRKSFAELGNENTKLRAIVVQQQRALDAKFCSCSCKPAEACDRCKQTKSAGVAARKMA